MNQAPLPQTLTELPILERTALADRLYASIPVDWQQSADQAWLDEAELRSAEIDENPSPEISYEAFIAGMRIPGQGRRK